MARKKPASGFLKAWIDSAPPIPDEPISAETQKVINEQRSIARAALDEIAKDIRADCELALMTRYISDKQRRGASKGGISATKAARAAAAKWQLKCVKRARELLADGKERHSLAGILAPEFHRTQARVRTVLQNASVMPKRKRKPS